MKNNFKLKIVLLFIFIFSFKYVFAVDVSLKTEKNTLDKNEVLVVNVLLNTDGKSINTLEGDLKYDSKFIQAENINIGGSFINFWVEKPNLQNPGIIHFSGITPGGIVTPKGEIFKIVFKTILKGETSLSLENINLYLNDGKGTIVNSKVKNLTLSINNIENKKDKNVAEGDMISPEKFDLLRTQDPSLFDNKYFLVFNSTDKQSGIDHYKICELFSCKIGESPYLLKNQTSFYGVFVFAYDGSGNYSISYLISPLFSYFIIGVFIVLLGFFVFRRYFYHPKI